MPRQVLQEKELRVLFLLIVLLFVVFLAAPLALVLVRSLTTGAGALTLANYLEVFSRPDFVQSIANSFAVSAASAFVAVLLAFLLSYTVNCTNVPAPLKRAIGLFAQLPMLVPTITYGFAIIYTFGRQGLLTRLLGFQLFDIYGFGGLMLGYVIYTLPTAFLLVEWRVMEKDGKWRYTSPTHVVLAFAQALRELDEEGGIAARAARYAENQRLLVERMEALGFRVYLTHHQGPIITTFLYPEGATFGFAEMYDYIKARGYVLYPGKLTEEETFRIGNIGEIYPVDIMNVTDALADFLAEQR